MIRLPVSRLLLLCEVIPPLLRAIGESQLTTAPSPEKWTKKQILGHLIDSAANNHQRFIRGQFEHEPTIRYDQVLWNRYGFYNNIPGAQLISMWEAYNRQIAALVNAIPVTHLGRKVRTDDLHTLEFLFEDYVRHLEHHLHQLVDYDL